MPDINIEEKTKHLRGLVESRMNDMMDILESAMTKQEILDAIKDMLDKVNKAKEDLGSKIDKKTQVALNDLESFKSDYKAILDELSQESSSKLSDIRQKALDRVKEHFVKSNIKGVIKDLKRDVGGKLIEVNEKLNEMYGYELPTTESIAEEASKLVVVEDLNLEVELPKQNKAVRNGLELLEGDERLKIEAIRDLRKELDELKESVKVNGSNIGGSVGRLYTEHQTFDGDGATVDFTLDYGVDASGKAAWVYLNGQFLVNSTHWSVSGTKLTLTFTPSSDDKIDVTYLRT